MKNIGAFFLLFVVFVSLLPCTDDITGIDEATSAYQLSHDVSSEESCSSICICACCGQRIVMVEQIQFHVQAPAQLQDHTIKKYQFYLDELSKNIWQPPKLA